jgi:hypothetical protein
MKNLLGFIFLVSSFLSLVHSYNSFPMGSNSSTPKLQARQQIILRSGVLVNIRETNNPKAKTKTCTFGFAVKRARGKGKGLFNQGYLTAASCTSSRGFGAVFDAFVIDAGGFEALVGRGTTLKGAYDPKQGLDYTIVKIDPDYWDAKSSMNVIVSNDPFQTAPITERIPPIVGTPVCFSSFYSGYVCGTVAKLKAVIPRLSPWINSQLQYHQQEYFQNLVLVRMDPGQVPTKTQRNGIESRDFGAPVFIPIPNPLNPEEILGVSPVGIFNGYAMMGIKLPFGAEVGYNAFFFYTPIDRILDNTRGLQLIKSPN